jgi:predicted nucleic acid-binding protein
VIELADTSALIVAHRVGAIGRGLQEAIGADDIAVCEIVELEYLTGARNSADYAAMEAAFAGYRQLTTEPRDWQRVRQIHRALAARGPGLQRSVRLPDLLVAAVAERHAVGVLHYDEEFDRIAAITGQATRWIAPRGSI